MDNLRIFLDHLGFGLMEGPSPADIKKRWKNLCQEHHPDRGGDESLFRKVTHAYKMLTDASYRNKCLLEDLKRGKPNGQGSLNIRMVVGVSFEEAFFGRALSLSYTVADFTPEGEQMPAKDGDQLELDTLRISLAPNSFNGFEAALPGKGHRCGSQRGDVAIFIQVLPHPKFRIEAGNILSVEQVPLDICLKGGKIEVVTMYGLKTLRVKPGTAPGSLLEIPKAGFHRAAPHLVKVEIAFPSTEDLKANACWKNLGIDWNEGAEEDLEAASYLLRFTTTGG
ncbi:MAG: DnaJ domain-containing protein [Dehalococcoidia bacterium]|nr:DnaJ domain-containing protein [Dehalococcoidia bacterium]